MFFVGFIVVKLLDVLTDDWKLTSDVFLYLFIQHWSCIGWIQHLVVLVVERKRV